MAKRVQWSKILGVSGVRIYKDRTAWGFWLKVEKGCTKKEVQGFAKKLRKLGYDASYYFHISGNCFGTGIVRVKCDELTVAKAKLTDREYKLLKKHILSGR